MEDEIDNKEFDLSILPLRSEKKIRKNRRKIDPRLWDCDRGQCCMLIAPPASGKTTLILNWFLGEEWFKGYYEELVVISPTMKNDATAKHLIENHPTYDYLDDHLINSIIKYRAKQEDETKKNLAIIVDDAPALAGFKPGCRLDMLASNYRHILKSGDGALGGLLLVSSQKIRKVPSLYRACASVVIVGKLNNEKELETLIDEYSGIFEGKKRFLECYNETFREGRFNFMVMYITGNKVVREPCIYKNFTEQLFP